MPYASALSPVAKNGYKAVFTEILEQNKVNRIWTKSICLFQRNDIYIQITE